MQPRFLLTEVGSGLRRNVSMAVSVVLVTMVSMFLLGLGLLAQRQADTMKGYWYDRIQVSIYLCTANSLQPNCENRAVTDAREGVDRAPARGAARGQAGLLRVRAGRLRALQGAVPQQPDQRQRPGRRHPAEPAGAARRPDEVPGGHRPVRRGPGGGDGPGPGEGPVEVLRDHQLRHDLRRGPRRADGGLRGPPHGDDDPAGGLHQTPRDRHHAPRRRLELDDPDAVHRRDGHRLGGRGAGSRWGCSSP